jgi:hypothetical protein
MNRLKTTLAATATLFAVAATAARAGGGVATDAGAAVTSTTAGSNALSAEDPNAPVPGPNTCKICNQNGQPLPDPSCTPGATNPGVTQADLDSTICKSGWTKTVRPPTSKTNKMKAASARSYGLGTCVKGEYDHLLSAALAV